MTFLRNSALVLLLVSAPAVLRAQPPAWAENPCVGLDCGAAVAAVGQAEFLPEMRISSAIAYAQAVKNLSSSLSNKMSSNNREFGENAGEEVDSAIKDLTDSPLGSALTKTYGGGNSDEISVAISLNAATNDAVRAYVQEFADPEERTLYVRVVMPRTSGEFRLGEGFSSWKGRKIRLSTQDVRVGRQNEFTLWVEDGDSGLTWVEQWPDGGADLMKNGQVAEKFVFDRVGRRWVPSAPKVAGEDATDD